jgi:hypothetical protein
MSSLVKQFAASCTQLPSSLLSLADQIAIEHRAKPSFRGAVTWTGQRKDESSSAVQKYSRRNETRKALLAVADLDMFNYFDRAGTPFVTNLVHRMMVCFLEDKGVAAAGWLERAELHRAAYEASRASRQHIALSDPKFHEKREQEMDHLMQFAAVNATGKHSRALSHLNAVFGKIKFDHVARIVQEQIPQTFAAIQDSKRTGFASAVKVRLASAIAGKYGDAAPETTDILSRFAACLESCRDEAFYWGFRLVERVKVGRVRAETALFDVLDASPFQNIAKLIRILRAWWSEMKNMAEGKLCWMYATLLCVRPGLAEWAPPADRFPFDAEDIYSSVLSLRREVLDDFVRDMHTAAGAAANVGRREFVAQGSAVAEECSVVEQYKRVYELVTLYEAEHPEVLALTGGRGAKKAAAAAAKAAKQPESRGKKRSAGEAEAPAPKKRSKGWKDCGKRGSYPKESELFDFAVRAQIPCGTNKQDTYFARDRLTGNSVLVKGPFPREGTHETIVLLAELKRKHFGELAAPSCWVTWAVPDLLPGSLSERTRVAEGLAYPFVVFEDLSGGANLPRMKKTTKTWPSVEVVDWANVKELSFPTPPLLSKNPNLMKQFALCVLFRFLFGIGDCALRNFVVRVRDGKLFSVDESNVMVDGTQLSLYKATCCQLLRNWFAANRTELLQTADAWHARFSQHRADFGEQLATFAEGRFNAVADAEVLDCAFGGSSISQPASDVETDSDS